MKILVVEDDADQRDLIRETLNDHFGKDTDAAVKEISRILRHGMLRNGSE